MEVNNTEEFPYCIFNTVTYVEDIKILSPKAVLGVTFY